MSEQVQRSISEFIERYCAAINAIARKYDELGRAPGLPAGEVVAAKKKGFYRRYNDGAIYWREDTGAHWVHGAIYEKYMQKHGEAGFLGFPLTDELGATDGVGRYNEFQGGDIYWTGHTGANEVHGDIRLHWKDLGAERSRLGYPLTDETKTSDGSGRFNHFEKGSVYWTSMFGAHAVLGPICVRWRALGAELSFLGYPTFDEQDWSDSSPVTIGRLSRFERGTIGMKNGSSVGPTVMPDSVLLQLPSLNSDLPLTGSATLMINSAGGFNFSGHVHDSGWFGYHVAIAAALNFRGTDGAVFVAQKEGHTKGTTEGGGAGRTFTWNDSGMEPAIRDNWDALKGSGITCRLKASTTAGDIVVAVLDSVLIAVGVALGAAAVFLFASGKAKVCSPQASVYRDPYTGQERSEVSFPVCMNDAETPDCCKEYGAASGSA